ncbi:MAG: serine/threonine protein kinase, partial [Myxococcales bacterium]|nr:serine/threonine protein kinase [Myxococcales bacterium]
MRACPRCLTVYQTDPEYCAFDGVQTGLYTEDADPLVGARLDAFRLEARLGIGGTGCVYRGTQLPQGEPVAIKLLFGEMATDKALAQRFRREAEAMRRIDHPNVVSVLACATSAVGLTYLVMEFVEGRTLKAIIEDEAPLSPGRVGRLAEQLVAGIGQAHRLGYVHRDLKPSNIIVRGAPGSEQAKILDFGIVASLQGETGDHRLTKTGYIVGTPTYMAPEQVDPRAVSPQVDVYALGAIFYELLTGKPPFTGTLEQILVAKMTSPAPRLTSVGELGDLVNRMLATEPEDRPPTALHVSAELARFSLLSSDPATERARVPSLADVGVVGFGQVTVQIVDHTVPTALTDGAARDTVEGPWSAPTRLTPAVLTLQPQPTEVFPDLAQVGVH